MREPTRRGFIGGLAGLFVAAPAVIRIPGLLMPIKPAALIAKPALLEAYVGNRLIEFRKQIFREYVRNNLFASYVIDDLPEAISFGGHA